MVRIWGKLHGKLRATVWRGIDQLIVPCSWNRTRCYRAKKKHHVDPRGLLVLHLEWEKQIHFSKKNITEQCHEKMVPLKPLNFFYFFFVDLRLQGSIRPLQTTQMDADRQHCGDLSDVRALLQSFGRARKATVEGAAVSVCYCWACLLYPQHLECLRVPAPLSRPLPACPARARDSREGNLVCCTRLYVHCKLFG